MNEAQKLIEYIVTNITGDPDCFSVVQTIDENGGLLTLSIDQSQAGRVIGKSGDTANAIRSLLRALGMKNSHRYHMKVSISE